MILTADLHLTDNPADEYRWDVFKALRKALKNDVTLVIAGDLTDRKDRHSAALVNRLVHELRELARGAKIGILMGNHDEPLKGAPFWSFLTELDNVIFFAEPGVMRVGQQEILMLPFSPQPKVDWAKLTFSDYPCIVMHQPVRGADTGDGHKIEADNMPYLPRGPAVYSGDIHYPQKVGVVTYIGAPHPVRFGDVHDCRFLKLGADFKVAQVIPLAPNRKHLLDASGDKDFDAIVTTPGDQIRVRYSLPMDRMAQWPVEKESIQEWAKRRGLILVSVEPILVDPHKGAGAGPAGLAAPDLFTDPKTVLAAFAQAEDIEASLIDLGQDILTESIAINQSK